MSVPTRAQAELLLQQGEACNPGPWGDHSRVTAQAAAKIAQACGDMDADRAYVVGLLHDIGRKFGRTYLRHVYDGWRWMRQLGYDEVAQVCLTHSFNLPQMELYIGEVDLTPAQLQELENALQATVYDDYDRLIQLCDSLATSHGIVPMEDRMNDVRRRYGDYPQIKWDKNMQLRCYFEQKTGRDLYELLQE